MTLKEIKEASELLRDEVTKSAITPSRLGNILVSMAELFATDEGITALKATIEALSTEAETRETADTALGNELVNMARQKDLDTEVSVRGLQYDSLKTMIEGKSSPATTEYALWSNYPANNTTYELGQQSTLVLSTNGQTPDTCADGTLIFFKCPDTSATSIVYADNTYWTGTDAPSVVAGGAYCIAIINGAYSLTQLTKQSL